MAEKNEKFMSVGIQRVTRKRLEDHISAYKQKVGIPESMLVSVDAYINRLLDLEDSTVHSEVQA